MTNVPDTLKYTKDHEWVLVEGSVATVGVTEFAQSELGEIVFVDVPAVGKTVSAGSSFCVLESTKAASDVYAPLGGTVSAANDTLKDDPTKVNSDPYGAGWLCKLEGFQAAELEKLMTAAEYKKHINA
jgi:glycine cleavage system H protein